MKKWIKARAAEGSTYAGLGLVTLGIGEIGKVKEAPAVAAAIEQAGALASAGALSWQGIAMILMGLAAAVLKDKGSK